VPRRRRARQRRRPPLRSVVARWRRRPRLPARLPLRNVSPSARPTRRGSVCRPSARRRLSLVVKMASSPPPLLRGPRPLDPPPGVLSALLMPSLPLPASAPGSPSNPEPSLDPLPPPLLLLPLRLAPVVLPSSPVLEGPSLHGARGRLLARPPKLPVRSLLAPLLALPVLLLRPPLASDLVLGHRVVLLVSRSGRLEASRFHADPPSRRAEGAASPQEPSRGAYRPPQGGDRWSR